MTNFKSVERFMRTFGQDVKTKAEFPSEKIVKLRYDLIKEELDEFSKALEDKDIPSSPHVPSYAEVIELSHEMLCDLECMKLAAEMQDITALTTALSRVQENVARAVFISGLQNSFSDLLALQHLSQAHPQTYQNKA